MLNNLEQNFKLSNGSLCNENSDCKFYSDSIGYTWGGNVAGVAAVAEYLTEEQIPWLHVEQGKVAEQSKNTRMQCSWRSVAASSFAASNL